MLLGDVVAADPGVVVGVAELVGDLGHARLARRAGAIGGPVPEGAEVDQFAERAVVDSLDGLLVEGVVVALEADADFEILLFGHLGGRQHAANSRSIDSDGLFHEGVFSLFDGIRKVDGPEMGRGREDRHVDAGVDGLLVGVEADEAALRRHVDLPGKTLVRFPVVAGVLPLAERGQAGFELVGEQVGHRPELHRPRGCQGLRGRAGAAAPASDQGDFERFAAGRVGRPGDGKLPGRDRHGRRGAAPLDEAAREIVENR